MSIQRLESWQQMVGVQEREQLNISGHSFPVDAISLVLEIETKTRRYEETCQGHKPVSGRLDIPRSGQRSLYPEHPTKHTAADATAAPQWGPMTDRAGGSPKAEGSNLFPLVQLLRRAAGDWDPATGSSVAWRRI